MAQQLSGKMSKQLSAHLKLWTTARKSTLRLENSLAPLHIVIAEHELDWMGRPISSTNIRRGIMDREGYPWLHEEIGLFDLIPEPRR